MYENIHFSYFIVPNDDNSTLESFTEVSSEKIKTYITSLSSDEAITNQLPLRIIKSILPIIIASITYIVNLSLRTGQFPDSCKQGGDNYDPNDYRPISILSIVSKCIEYCANEQLSAYFENNNLLTEHQYGFGKNHSTTYLTLEMFNKLFDSKQKHNTPAIIFLDIKKAFDTVDHKILIDKLKFYGIVNLWIESYLTGTVENKQQNFYV